MEIGRQSLESETGRWLSNKSAIVRRCVLTSYIKREPGNEWFQVSQAKFLPAPKTHNCIGEIIERPLLRKPRVCLDAQTE